MKAIVLVLNKVECLEKLLVRLAEQGVKGGTIIDSTGMARALGDSEDLNILGSLRMFLDPSREESKTMFFVVEDCQVATVKKAVYEIVGDLNMPQTGILFGVDLNFVDGVASYD